MPTTCQGGTSGSSLPQAADLSRPARPAAASGWARFLQLAKSPPPVPLRRCAIPPRSPLSPPPPPLLPFKAPAGLGSTDLFPQSSRPGCNLSRPPPPRRPPVTPPPSRAGQASQPASQPKLPRPLALFGGPGAANLLLLLPSPPPRPLPDQGLRRSSAASPPGGWAPPPPAHTGRCLPALAPARPLLPASPPACPLPRGRRGHRPCLCFWVGGGRGGRGSRRRCGGSRPSQRASLLPSSPPTTAKSPRNERKRIPGSLARSFDGSFLSFGGRGQRGSCPDWGGWA